LAGEHPRGVKNIPPLDQAMAVSIPMPPTDRQDTKLSMPMPPPLMHTRSGNELYERPQTPTSNGFTSPMQTPQGSPSKKQFPPGANDLPSVFDHAMKLAPVTSSQGQQKSPNKQELSVSDDNTSKYAFADGITLHSQRGQSPTRMSNKGNAPATGPRFAKDIGIQQNHAALSRHEQYQPAETKKTPQTRGLTTEELQKLQGPRIKRLANVTQLCKPF